YRLVLADLRLGRQQVAETEALERLDAAARRLRVLHRGSDQLVEIDVLDVEGFAHMGTAVTQQLHDLVAVTRRVEFGLDRIRPGGDLAQRQRGGENLDQDGVHWHDMATHGVRALHAAPIGSIRTVYYIKADLRSGRCR